MALYFINCYSDNLETNKKESFLSSYLFEALVINSRNVVNNFDDAQWKFVSYDFGLRITEINKLLFVDVDIGNVCVIYLITVRFLRYFGLVFESSLVEWETFEELTVCIHCYFQYSLILALCKLIMVYAYLYLLIQLLPL